MTISLKIMLQFRLDDYKKLYVDKQLFITAYILAPSSLLNFPIFCYILIPLKSDSARLLEKGTKNFLRNKR